MKIRDLLAVVGMLMFVGASYAYMAHADAESASRDAQVPP